jgi:hypothetical protein
MEACVEMEVQHSKLLTSALYGAVWLVSCLSHFKPKEGSCESLRTSQNPEGKREFLQHRPEKTTSAFNVVLITAFGSVTLNPLERKEKL